MDVETVRLDKWLVAVRVFKTRALAAEACGGGKVRVGGRVVKASYSLKVGDRISARVTADFVRELEVVRLIEKRVGAALAVECFVDHSEPREPGRRDHEPVPFERDAGAGRPTKRDRRRLDRLRGR